MPFSEVSIMESRLEFVMLANQEGANLRELCRRFGVSAPTGYKWLARFREHGSVGLHDGSRAPTSSPHRTPAALETAILAERESHPAWGGRKLRHRLLAQGLADVPSASTITAILRRRQRLDPEAAAKHRPWQRFTKDRPNELWQMDFKGHIPLENGGRCHPLTVLDDYSRFNVVLQACADERATTVQRHLVAVFRQYGLPEAMLMDNGSPWGDAGDQPYTRFTVWLLRLGIAVYHGRPYHPQTQGKEERFHRTLNAEVLAGRTFADVPQCQGVFTVWRPVYNFERPHEALGMATPGSQYQMSPRPYPEHLPELVYAPGDRIRKVDINGGFFWQGERYRLSRAFIGQHIGLRPTLTDGRWDIYFGRHHIALLDLNQPDDPCQRVNHVSEHL